MAFHAILKVDGVDGEATTEGYEGGIDLASFSMGAHNSTSRVGSGAGSGQAEISDFTVTKKTDQSSAKLFQACCGGKHFDTATVTILKAGGEEAVDYLTYEFEELFVTDMHWSGASNGDDVPMESLALSFGTVKVTYTTQNADGTKGEPQVAGWDVKHNKAI